MLTLLLAVSALLTPAFASVTCQSSEHPAQPGRQDSSVSDERVYDSIGEAVDDPSCDVVIVGPGVYWEEVDVRRPLTLVGAGREDTVLFCVDGPCIDIDAGGGTVVIARLSVASTATTIASRGGELDLLDLRIAPLGHRGGLLKLRDSRAELRNVDMEVVNLPAIDAVSGHGSDLDLERVRFYGVPGRSGVRSVLYSSNYGVSCNDCSFQAGRPDVVGELLWGDDEITVDTGLSDSHFWPQMFCPIADDDSMAVCEAQCGDDAVALCRMTWKPMSEGCLPRGVCVPSGEVPDSSMLLVRR